MLSALGAADKDMAYHRDIVTKLPGWLQVVSVEQFYTRLMQYCWFFFLFTIFFFVAVLDWKENDSLLLDFPSCHVIQITLGLTEFL